ncbi:MAG: 2-hydroxychromene-2-carboxylate isomerase [Polyangiales bacterium]
MTRHSPLDYWFDYTCPYAYLGSVRVEALADRLGLSLRWKPMLLGGVFKANDTPQRLFETLSPAKARHNADDLQRWAALYGVTLVMPSAHPMRSVEALRATLACGCDARVIHGFYRAYWVEGRPISDRAVIADVVRAAGHDPDAVLAAIERDEVKDDLRRRTDEAIALGVFGAPTYALDGELYWGQDRAELVAAAVQGPPAPDDAPAAAPTGRTLEVYWDFSSPYAYLGCAQAEALARRTGATLVWRPLLLGGLFKSIGQADVPLSTYPAAKQRHTGRDLERWAARWGVPFKFPSRFPMSTVAAMRAWIALPEARRAAFQTAVFRAYWADDRDIADESVLAAIVGEDGPAVLARARSPEVKDALREATARAAEAGVFGVPTWVVDGRELLWGQDRLPLVERALR